MLFSRYVRARKYNKTLSCNFFGVHVSLVHSLTLLIVAKRTAAKGNVLNSYVCCIWTMSIEVLSQNSYINVIIYIIRYEHFMAFVASQMPI